MSSAAQRRGRVFHPLGRVLLSGGVDRFCHLSQLVINQRFCTLRFRVDAIKQLETLKDRQGAMAARAFNRSPDVTLIFPLLPSLCIEAAEPFAEAAGELLGEAIKTLELVDASVEIRER